MKVLFLPNNCAGVDWWRMKQFHDEMNRQRGRTKVDAHIYNFDETRRDTGWWERAFVANEQTRGEIFHNLRNADVVISGFSYFEVASALNAMYTDTNPRTCKQTGGPKVMVVECDDDVFRVPAYNPAYKDIARLSGDWNTNIVRHFKTATGLVTSTPYLADLYSEHNRRIVCIPNAIDFRLWKPNKRNLTNKIRIGWVGGGNHSEDMRIMPEVIAEVTKNRPNAHFFFKHGAPGYIRDIPGVVYDPQWVVIGKYPEACRDAKMDIGIAPLVDNRFNRGKSNIRWLEYTALGIPTVASDVGPYKEIEHGKTGYKCSTAAEWTDALIRLIDDEKARREMAALAYLYIQKHYNLSIVTRRYIATLVRWRNEQSAANI